MRETRNDFESAVTFDPAGPIDEFTRSVGWCSQDELPGHYRAADICLVPTIAQDALSITSVEAMAAGIPVIASRIGGLPYTVSDGLTGPPFEPGMRLIWLRRLGDCWMSLGFGMRWGWRVAGGLRRTSSGRMSSNGTGGLCFCNGECAVGSGCAAIGCEPKAAVLGLRIWFSPELNGHAKIAQRTTPDPQIQAAFMPCRYGTIGGCILG